MGKTILIAEDDPEIADMLQLMLEEAGYEVETVGEGHAVQQMHEPFPDLMLLDILLSGMDGRTICRQVKSQEVTRHLPIILISAHPDARQMARDAGADDFLAKPFEMGDLLELVAKYLS